MAERGSYDKANVPGSGSEAGTPGQRHLRQQAVTRGRQEVEALNATFRTSKGWGSDERSTIDSRGVPTYLGFQGRQGSESVRVHAVHFSGVAGLTALDGHAYGTSSARKEKAAVAAFPAGHPRRRIVPLPWLTIGYPNEHEIQISTGDTGTDRGPHTGHAPGAEGPGRTNETPGDQILRQSALDATDKGAGEHFRLDARHDRALYS